MVDRQPAPDATPLPVSAHRPRRVIANPAPATPGASVRVRHLHRPLLRPRAHPPSSALAAAPPAAGPAAKPALCPHGRRLSCGQRHKDTDPAWARPLCPDCYDYAAAVVWNAHAPELWRRTTIAIRRQLARAAKAAGAGKVQLSYAKVAEFQARGLVHFHAIFRLDATTHRRRTSSRPPSPPRSWPTPSRRPPRSTWFATVAHPARPKGWDITLGRPARHPHRPAPRRRPDHQRRGRLVPGQVRHQVHRGGRHRRLPDHRRQRSPTTATRAATRAG